MDSAYTEAWSRLGPYVVVAVVTAAIAVLGDVADLSRATTLLLTTVVLVPIAVVIVAVSEGTGTRPRGLRQKRK
jgi:hypothetical protein